MNSFYGGKQGLTYNIVLRFGSVALMVTAFRQGGAYTKVNYGLYVIIDTISINRDYTNKENGLLFRRGFDYSKDLVEYTENIDWQTWLENGVGGGAIYVGQISGPMGKSSEIRLSGIDDFPSGANITTVDSSIVFKPATTAAISDQFQLKYTNVSTVVGSNQNASTQLVSQIGLQIPYSNINISATTVDSYGSSINHNDISWTPGENGSFIHKIGNLLYQDLQIAIPKAVKGDSLKSITAQSINNTPYVTLFKITPIITRYDNSAEGESEEQTYQFTLESLAVDKLKLMGDYLYYHTSKNRNVDNKGTSIDNLIWNPLGSPGGQFHIYNYFQAQDKNSALESLWEAYPNGIDLATEDPTKAGWVVAIKYDAIIEGLTETVTELYAYDYTSNSTTVADKWFPLANFSSMMITPETVVILKERDNTSSNPLPDGEYRNLAVNGLWFLQLDLIAKSENWDVLNKTQEEEE